MPPCLVAGRFELGPQVGRGGMGTVYEARDLERGGMRVAVKVLNNASDADRFMREARVLAKLDHPGVVRYVAHGYDADAPYLAMEWLQGEDLATRLSRGPLDPHQAIAVARRVADALGAAHRAGIVHRDVKPSNIFLPGGSTDTAKVLDFGVARWVRGTGALTAARTASGVVLGTPQYLAPEQARGEPDIDERADVFALGCVLFECLVGRPAFVAEHVVAVLAKVLLEEVPRPSSLRSDVSESVDALVARMTAKLRDGRPADGAAAAMELGVLAEALSRTASRPTRSVTDAAARSLPPMADEQRLAAVVLARPRAIAPAVDETLDFAQLSVRCADARLQVERFGGTAEALADGSVCALFTEAVVAKDLAAQGARCALALRAMLEDFVVALVMTRTPATTPRCVADAFDKAASLVRDCGPDPRESSVVWVDALAARLLDDQFDVDGDRLVGERLDAAIARGSRVLLARAVPCVGRDRELATLRALYEECVEEPRSLAVVVTAPSGTGKSRVAAELAAILGGHPSRPVIRAVSGEPLRAGTAFGMLRPLLERIAAIRPGDAPDAVQSALRTRVAGAVHAADVDRVTVYLAEIAGAPFPVSAFPGLDASRRDAVLMREQTRRALCDWLAGECRSSPLVLVLDDLHWGDGPTVHLIEGALRELADRPLFVVALARPEIDDVFPNLWAAANAQRMRLGPLGKKASAVLVRSVLGERARTDTLERIVGLAQGNPFFLEELIRAAAETSSRDGLPETVVAVAGERVRRLAPAPRRVLRAACIFGETFWVEGVMALLGETERPDDVIAELVAEELVSPRPASRFPHATELAFRHALVQEAAYATLLDGDRARGHQAAAAWLEDVGEKSCAVIAEHHDRGGNAALAAEWFLRAAEEANDFQAALRFVARAEDLGVPRGERTCRLLLARGRALYGLSRWAEAQETLTRALDHAEGDARRAEVLLALTERADAALDPTAMVRLASDAVTLAANSGHPELQVMGIGHLALGHSIKGDLVQADALAQQARLFARAANAYAPALSLLSTLVSYWRGDLATAIVNVPEDVAAARAASDRTRLVYLLPALGMVLASSGRYAEAREAFEEARRLADVIGAPALGAWSRAFAVGMHLDVHDWDAVTSLAEEARAFAARADWKHGIASAGIDLVFAATGRGEIDRASRLVDEIAPILEGVHDWHGWIWEMRLACARGELAHARGEPREAVAWADRSLAANPPERRPKYRARALALRGRARLAIGEHEAARDDLNEAMRVIQPTGDLPALVTVAGELLAVQSGAPWAQQVRGTVQALAGALPEGARTAFLRAPAIARVLAVEPAPRVP